MAHDTPEIGQLPSPIRIPVNGNWSTHASSRNGQYCCCGLYCKNNMIVFFFSHRWNAWLNIDNGSQGLLSSLATRSSLSRLVIKRLTWGLPVLEKIKLSYYCVVYCQGWWWTLCFLMNQIWLRQPCHQCEAACLQQGRLCQDWPGTLMLFSSSSTIPMSSARSSPTHR